MSKNNHNLLYAVTLIALAFILMMMLLFSSCVKETESEPITVSCKVTAIKHIPSQSTYGYHYGFYMGKYQGHFGYETVPEKNIVQYVFLRDTVETNNKELYNNISMCPGINPSVSVSYVKVFHDSVFHHNKIIEIK
jgi:hypothetical protein